MFGRSVRLRRATSAMVGVVVLGAIGFALGLTLAKLVHVVMMLYAAR